MLEYMLERGIQFMDPDNKKRSLRFSMKLPSFLKKLIPLHEIPSSLDNNDMRNGQPSIPEAPEHHVEPTHSTINQGTEKVINMAIKLIFTLIGIIMTMAVVSYIRDVSRISGELSVIRDSLLPQINSSISDVKENVDKLDDSIDKMNQDINDISVEIARIGERLPSTYEPVKETKTAISEGYNDVVNQHGSIQLLADTVAIDRNTREPYDIDQLADHTILLPYREDGQEVFFYGQFNNKGHWDGNCIINVYKNGILQRITDANYDDGKLLSSKEVFPYVTARGQSVWAISDRIRKDGSGSGETWFYIRTNMYDQHFEFDDVAPINILSVEKFKLIIDTTQVEGYYHGDVSDGYFNDKTGNSFMVYFFPNGKVRTLYVGNFAYGTFNDDTGDAWEISKENNTTYMYYRGTFSNGHSDPGNIFENYLTLPRIKEIIAGKGFDNLQWDFEEQDEKIHNTI